MRETISMLGFIQAIFGMLLFITKRPGHLSFVLLTVWLLVIAIFQGALLLPFEVVDYFKPGIFPILFVFGPLLYFYVSSLVIEDFRFKKKHFIHFLPLLLICLHRSFTDAVSVTISSNNVENAGFSYNMVYFILLSISLFVYWIFSVKLILIHRKSIPFYFSNYTQRNTLNWLVFVVLIFLLMFWLNILFSSIERVFNLNIIRFFALSTNLTIFTFIVVFLGINQSVIYNFKKQQEEIGDNESEEKYKHSTLNEIMIADINRQVFEYLTTKKPYLNSEFSFQMMVDDLGISRQNLSQVINAGQKKNFYKLINEFRVKEVKALLLNPKYEHYTILGIAFECGFNSKTSFNRIFKEETGLTPSVYKKSI